MTGRQARRATVALSLAGLCLTSVAATAGGELPYRGQAANAPVGAAPELAAARAALGAEPRDPSGRAGSGGRAVVHRSGARAPRVSSTAQARLHRTGHFGIEPTIGVLRNGWLFVQAISQARPLRSLVLRSRNGGRTFDDVSPRNGDSPTHPTTQDPYLYVEPRTGTVFTNDYVGCGQTSSTRNGAESWSLPSLTCSNLADHQTLFGGPPVTSTTVGYPEVLYYCAVTLVALNKGTSAGCTKSLDGGATFAPTGALAFTPEEQRDSEGRVMGWCSGLIGHGTVGPDGTVYLPKACSSPYLLVSRNEGLTWTKVTLPTSLGVNTDMFGFPDHEAAVAVDARGVVSYLWMARNRMPYLMTSRNRGATWSRPLMVAPPGVNETVMPALAVTPGGRVAMAYLGTRESPGRPFPNDSDCYLHDGDLLFRCPIDSAYARVRWNSYLTVTDDPLRADPTFTSVSINDPNDPLTVGECGPFRCQQQYDFGDVQMGPDGTPWSVFVDGCNEERRCRSTGEAIVGRIVGLPRHR